MRNLKNESQMLDSAKEYLRDVRGTLDNIDIEDFEKAMDIRQTINILSIAINAIDIAQDRIKVDVM